MSHGTATVVLSTADAEEIMSEYAPSYRSSWGYVDSKYAKLARYAARIWSDDPDSDKGSPNINDSYYAGLFPSEVIDHIYYEKVRDRTPIFGVASTKDITYKSVTVSIEVTGEQLRGLRGKGYGTTNEICAAAEKLVVGKNVVPYSGKVKLPTPRKFQATATEGKAVTKYDIISVTADGARTNRGQKDSQAEARAAALDLAQRDADAFASNPRAYAQPVSYEVQAVVVRDTGSAALVIITRPEPEKATIAVTFQTYTVKANAKPVSYLVAFDYYY